MLINNPRLFGVLKEDMALSLGIEPRTRPPEGHVISISPRERRDNDNGLAL